MSSLPDGAEYWWDVKSNNRHRYHPTHATVNHCHIKGGDDSNIVSEIDCHYCKKLMTLESVAEMESRQKEVNRRMEQSAIAKRDLLKHKMILKNPNSPICTCGFPMVIRINRTKGNHFYGCTNYPKCKQTKSR